MKKNLSITIAAFLFAIPFLFSAQPSEVAGVSPDILRLLSDGNQKAAEARLEEKLRADPKHAEAAFLAAVCTRSRFDTKESVPGFLAALVSNSSSLQGLVSACILGIDTSKDQATALYYYDALLVLCRQNPSSIPARWMAAVMSRTLTRERKFHLSPEVHKRILQAGICEYEAVLALMAPGPGPVLVHQTLANLLDDSQAYDEAWKHREIAVKMERAPWSLHAAAWTALRLGRAEEALALVREAIAQAPNRSNYYQIEGDALWSLGRGKDAIAAWDRASSFGSYESFYWNLCARGCRDLGDYVSAREYTRKSLAKDPKDPSALIWDARMAAVLGEAGAGERVAAAGIFDFRGNPVKGDCPAGKTSDPWFLAAETGDLGKIRQMMGGVDINARNPVGYHQTALMNAACNGWEKMAEELIRAGAKLDLVDDNGNTALHYSAQFVQPRLMKLLLDAGAKTDIQDKWKQTPLIMCANDRSWDGFRLLLEKKANTALATPHGGTALHYAAGHGDLDMVDLLLASGADAGSTSQRNGDTPLINACREWAHSYIATPLIAAGADVNASDKEGRSALHHAVEPLLNLPLVELLLEKGADPTRADKKGTTSIAQARLLGFEELASRMETLSAHPEPFRFPQFESPDSNASASEKNAALFVLPILLAQGHPLGRPSGVPAGEKPAARRELSRMFGIESAANLKDELQALAGFHPSHRDDLSADIPSDRFHSLLEESARKIFDSCRKMARDESAWTEAHRIYLADLGMSAGFLDSQEGEKIIGETSAALRGRFSSWTDFSRSFLLGAQIHNGWEARRYEHICNRLIEANLPWAS